ncbi:hypothetical protein ACFO26_05015 [Lactococcus nasutitermitis]|uniref:Uncharacterized protein n=1 Tax=Lactococcus nasutitermitis TaxID=1652957 RepID=A0ABV9JCL2_9LACT|nr:hypothetical protein [Lactococcus nasutitermitis]
MKKKHMFRPREDGWGLTPQTRDGVLAVLVYLLVAIVPIVITTGLASSWFRVHSSTLTLPIIVSMCWLLFCVLAAIGFVSWYLKKYYSE